MSFLYDVCSETMIKEVKRLNYCVRDVDCVGSIYNEERRI